MRKRKERGRKPQETIVGSLGRQKQQTFRRLSAIEQRQKKMMDRLLNSPKKQNAKSGIKNDILKCSKKGKEKYNWIRKTSVFKCRLAGQARPTGTSSLKQ
jgi:hypothetical protein